MPASAREAARAACNIASSSSKPPLKAPGLLCERGNDQRGEGRWGNGEGEGCAPLPQTPLPIAPPLPRSPFGKGAHSPVANAATAKCTAARAHPLDEIGLAARHTGASSTTDGP